MQSVFCVDCVAALEQYQKFKGTVERSFVTLENLVLEKGLNKNDYLEMLEIMPRVSPDPDAMLMRETAKPVKILWKCPGRPRKDGTAAQPRFFKKPKAPRVYDSDSCKSNSSDENFCRRSDNEEWNPDNKNISLNKKYKMKQNNGSKSGGKRGRPKKVLDDATQGLNETKADPHLVSHNGILTKSDQFNGNHTKMFGKRPRGRPPKTDIPLEGPSNDPFAPISIKKAVLQDTLLNNLNEFATVRKKGRGRPKKSDTTVPTTALKIVVNKKLKTRTKKPSKIKSINKQNKRGRPKKTAVASVNNSKKSTNNEIGRKRKRSQMEKSVDWATETEEEIQVKEEIISDSDEKTEDLEVRPNNYTSFILAS